MFRDILDVFEAIGFWYFLVAVINSSVSLLWVKSNIISNKIKAKSAQLNLFFFSPHPQFFHLDIFAFVGLLWQLATLVFIYHKLRDYPPRNGTDHAFVNAPFSIYTAYSFFIVLWQIFQFSNQTKHNGIVSFPCMIVVLYIVSHTDTEKRKNLTIDI